MTPAHPYLDGVGFACFAHRGGSDERPENSERAFAHAIDLGYRFIETDVQATLDGTVVVFHDDALDHLTDGSGIISDLAYRDVSQARIGGSEPIMRLDELLEAFPDTSFNIDIKTDRAVEPMLTLVRSMNCLDRVCLASFSDERLRRVREALGPSACTGAGPSDVTALKFASWRIPMRPVAALCAQVPLKQYGIPIVTRGFIRHCNRRGIAVHVWTINDEAEMRRLIRLGVDGIMTDRPSVLKTVAMEEGVW